MGSRKPVIHGRDHAVGGADEIPGIGGGGGGLSMTLWDCYAASAGTNIGAGGVNSNFPHGSFLQGSDPSGAAPSIPLVFDAAPQEWRFPVSGYYSLVWCISRSDATAVGTKPFLSQSVLAGDGNGVAGTPNQPEFAIEHSWHIGQGIGANFTQHLPPRYYDVANVGHRGFQLTLVNRDSVAHAFYTQFLYVMAWA
jgi:hypothetical protein